MFSGFITDILKLTDVIINKDADCTYLSYINFVSAIYAVHISDNNYITLQVF